MPRTVRSFVALAVVLAPLGCGTSKSDAEPGTTSSSTDPAEGSTSGGGGSTTGEPTPGSSEGSTSSTGVTGVDSSSTSDDPHEGPKLDVGEIPDVGVGENRECEDLQATIRDFSVNHPDFQDFWGNGPTVGLVLPQLGDDGTPVWAGISPFPPQITSQQSFADWYHDVDGVNESFVVELPLVAGKNGVLTYDNQSFFPIDGMGYGDEGSLDWQGDLHNFHFTTEVHVTFEYAAGQSFTFTGDDDLWMFIDGELVVDLGGLHPAATDTVDLDTLGLDVGQSYTMDIFHAERSTDRSTFRIDTTIDCFLPPS